MRPWRLAAGLLPSIVLLAQSPAIGTTLVDRVSRDESGRCTQPGPERPYVCDVGEARPLSMRSFREVLSTNDAAQAVVQRLGYPDRAELQRVSVGDPWLGWEIRTYYFSLDRMMVFGKAFVLDRPEISKLRYAGRIPPAKWAQLVVRNQPWDQLADAAAVRAEQAAADADRAADRGDLAAGRAEAVGDTMSTEFHRSLIKR